MASLFDTLGTPQSTQALAPPTDAANKLQSIVDVGTTGKAAPAAGPKRSSLAEAGALDDVKAGMAQLNQQQTQTLKAQQTQAHFLDMEDMIQNKQMDQSVLDMRSRALASSTQMLGDLERGTKQLNTEKAQVELEQVGFNLRQANERYIFNLQMEGTRNRLDHQIAFDEALQASIFGANYDIALHNSAAAIDMNAEQNEFLIQLGKMDISTAVALSEDKARQAQTAAIGTGMASAAEAGGKYYSDTYKAPAAGTAPTPNATNRARPAVEYSTPTTTAPFVSQYAPQEGRARIGETP